MVPRGSSKGCQDSASSCSWNVHSTDSVAENMPTDQAQIMIEMLSRLNAGMKSAETQGTDTVQPRHLGKALLL